MQAIIETGGKQYKVSAGDVLKVELLGKETGETVEIPNVKLLIDDNNNTIVPSKNAKVTGKVIEEVKGEKVIIFKFRRRKESQTKKGHRQRYSLIKIENIQK